MLVSWGKSLNWGVVPHAARQCPVIEMNLAVNVGSVVSARFATLQYHALIALNHG
jgi:hypothetical protein